MYNYRSCNQTLYNLKQHYGKDIQITVVTNRVADQYTGKITATRTEVIVRVVLAPPSTMRRHLGPNINSGIPEEQVELIALVDHGDIPALTGFENWEVKVDDTLFRVLRHKVVALGAPIVLYLGRVEGSK